jgi:hypothetical protein
MSNLKIQGNAGGAGTTTLQSGNTSNSPTFSLPIADGTNGQALVTNGSGVMSFATVGTDASLITSGTLPIARGGTGTTSTTFADLATNVTGTLPVANGGTGLATLTANNVILGNGTSAPSFVAPSTNGNVLTSNGTTWTSATPASGSPLVFLGTTFITSPVATVGFTGLNSSTYIAFMLQFQGMEPGSDGNTLRMQVGNSKYTGGSGGYFTSNYYANVLTNGATNVNTGSVSSWQLTSTGNVRSSTNGGCHGIAWVSQVSNSSALPSFFSDVSWWGYAAYTSRAGGPLDSTEYAERKLVTQVRLFYASGDINNGRVSIYGLKAS